MKGRLRVEREEKDAEVIVATIGKRKKARMVMRDKWGTRR